MAQVFCDPFQQPKRDYFYKYCTYDLIINVIVRILIWMILFCWDLREVAWIFVNVYKMEFFCKIYFIIECK